MQVNLYEAKTKLPSLPERAARGEEIIIAKRGRPMAVLGPLPSKVVPRRPGAWAGKMKIADDFDAPLPDDILDAVYGEHEK